MARRLSDRLTFGGRMPGVVGLVLVLTVVASLVAAFGSRHGAALMQLGALSPPLVWKGQLWRLVTWSFIEPSPWWLLFSCLALYWVGRDLVTTWGVGRFVRAYAAIVLATSVGTCLIGLADGAVAEQAFLGTTPVVAALVVAWGLYHPWRTRSVWFIPIRGWVLAWLTVGFTVVLAIFYTGWESLLPLLLAEATMIAWAYKNRLRARLRRAPRVEEPAWTNDPFAAPPRRRPYATPPSSVTEEIRRLEAMDDDPPPLSAEVEELLDKILDDVSREERARRSQSDSDR
jgi:membrane associated rhomboid family serine protease